MTNLLLVDDDQVLLRTLLRFLTKNNPSWRIRSCDDPLHALKLLEDCSFDAIISDLEMPLVFGDEVLARCSRISSTTIRILMSANREYGLILRNGGLAHEYLEKPFNLNELEEAIRRSFAIREELHKLQLKRFSGDLNRAIEIPRLYSRIRYLVASPPELRRELTKCIQAQPDIDQFVYKNAKQLLRIPNVEARSTEQLLGFLGEAPIKALVLIGEIKREIVKDAECQHAADEIVEHAIDTARTSYALAQALGQTRILQQTAISGSLLHNIGSLLMLALLGPKYHRSYKRASEIGNNHLRLERVKFGISHDVFGAYLLSLWQFPSVFLETSLYYLRPWERISCSDSVVDIVALANAYLRVSQNPAYLLFFRQVLQHLSQNQSPDQLRSLLAQLDCTTLEQLDDSFLATTRSRDYRS